MSIKGDYMRNLRASNEGYAARNRQRIAARRRALNRLAEMEPEKFERLYREELQANDAQTACPVCGTGVRLTTKGLIRKHRFAEGARNCEGSGRAIEEAA